MDTYTLGVVAEIISPSDISAKRLSVAQMARIHGVSRQAMHRKLLTVAKQSPELRSLLRCIVLKIRKSKLEIAFSGDKEYNGKVRTEASINGFPGSAIEKTFKKEPYRFLIVADKFQTGYDEPLLHTMYIDKVLSDIKAVQTLSRLNRACPLKRDTFVLDFAENEDAVREAFNQFYRTTILADETDPNKLFDLIAAMEKHQIYSSDDIDRLVELYINNAGRDKLDPILDACTGRYSQELDEAAQIEFKGAAKAFARTYGFLGAILPYGNAEWEKLAIFLKLLIPKLPSPDDPDLAKGILETIDLESYRVEAQTTIAIHLDDRDAEIDPVPAGHIGGKPEPELDPLTSILKIFNETFGNIAWVDADRVRKKVSEIPAMVSQDEKYQNAMKNSDKQNARIESDRVLASVMFGLMSDDMELYKQFIDNPAFKKWLADMVFSTTYNKEGKPYTTPA